MVDDTIAAISTPLGEGGIGIIRISGAEAINIAKKIFKPVKNINWVEESYRLVYGFIHSPEDGLIIDEVLIAIMQAPYTYTREDVIEINCHGGAIPLRKTMEVVLNMGARLAEPGEFSKRAFLNGRLDLAQAESIIDIIRAGTEDALRLAVGQLSGGLSKKYEEIQNELLQITALIEANIDFPEDEVDEYNLEEIHLRVTEIAKKINELIKGAETGKVYREGVRTVIAGKPNVGKSSLLNVLLKENRAIVTEIPGTTRDIIEEILNVGGVPLKIIDTAGIRNTEDVIEKIGVQRTRENIEKADLVILVFDASVDLNLEDKEIIELVKNIRGIKVLNKIDLDEDESKIELISNILPEWPLVKISALEEKGIQKLEKQIVDLVTGGHIIPKDGTMVTNVRHKHLLKKSMQHLIDVQNAVEQKMPLDLIAIDVRGAWEAVGEITGTVSTENILDKIFDEFCIGK